jgi:hypothetical protein
MNRIETVQVLYCYEHLSVRWGAVGSRSYEMSRGLLKLPTSAFTSHSRGRLRRIGCRLADPYSAASPPICR